MAIGWLVYRLTDSPLLPGGDRVRGEPISRLPHGPFAGALADRWDRYRMVMAAQICLLLQAVVLAVLVLSGSVEVWHLVALSVVSA